MEKREIVQIFTGALILFAVLAFGSIVRGESGFLIEFLLYSFVIICVSIGAKKVMARALDADVEHEIWQIYYFGIRPKWHFKKELPGGVIIPLFITIFSLGGLPFLAMSILTYEARALKRRAAKRFGLFSYKEMTDRHYAYIGAAGILAMFVLSVICYMFNLETLAQIASFYAFSNMIPYSKLDGMQILIGSRVIYSVLAALSIIFLLFALAI